MAATLLLGLLKDYSSWGDYKYWLVWKRPRRVIDRAKLLRFRSLSAGITSVCGVTTQGVIYCWGNNFSGQLGNGTTAFSTVPVPVKSDLTFKSVSTGFTSTCGVTTQGAIYCWGNNYNSHVPVKSDLTFKSVSTSGYNPTSSSTSSSHTCGVTTQGAIYCWGDNSNGQLGNGTTASSTVPVPVKSDLTFKSVSTGYYNMLPNSSHTCGVTTQGAIYCWGLKNTSIPKKMLQ